MDFRKSFLIIAGFLLGSLFMATVLAYGYLALNARHLFNDHMSALTKHVVEVRSVRAIFPATILVDGFSVAGVFVCDRMRVTIDIVSLLKRHMLVRKLELFRPVVRWQREARVLLNNNGVSVAKSSVGSSRTLIADRVIVHDGVVKIISNDEVGGARVHVLEEIQLRAENVPLSDTPVRTEFFMTASLAKLDVPFVGHFLKMNGWINWAARDMDAQAQAVDDDGRIGLDVKLASRQNDMAVFGSVHLTGDQGPQAVGERSGLVENVVLGALSSTETDVDADFSFKTKMDAPDLGAVRFSGRITTGLNSHVTSGNIVAGLKAAGEELFKQPTDLGVEK